MDGELLNKVVLVTGAAGGIGSKICGAFEKAGARVYSTDIVPNDKPRFICGDLCDASFIEQWVKQTLDKESRIDILINNAGICPRTDLLEITPEEWRKVLDVNLTSAFFLSQLCMKQMILQRFGIIINLASLAGKVGGIAVGAHYSASKAAIGCLTKAFARYGAPYGIRVNAVAPGVIDTDITRSATPEQIETFKKTIPLGYVADADEVVGPIMFLASSQSSYITGATVDINGGLLMD